MRSQRCFRGLREFGGILGLFQEVSWGVLESLSGISGGPKGLHGVLGGFRSISEVLRGNLGAHWGCRESCKVSVGFQGASGVLYVV